MKNSITALALSAALAAPACTPYATSDETAGAVVGGAVGALTATALDASPEWTIIGTLAGAGVGAMVARNSRTGECAYSNGDGTYYRAPCRR